MKKLWIAHVIQHYLPSPCFGGSPVVCHNIVENLLKHKNLEIDIITTDAYDKALKKIKIDGNERKKILNKFSWTTISKDILLTYKQQLSN